MVVWSGGSLTPVGKAFRERRLSTPRPVATSALVHPVRRKTPQEAVFASEEAEAVPTESNDPQRKTTQRIRRSL